MKKLKIISIICATFMLLGCLGAFPAIAATPGWASEGGTGTAEDPFILNQNNFETWVLSNSVTSAYMGSHYKLTSDIDLNPGWTASATEPTTNVWTSPIGEKNAFSGVFDGNGYAISGIYLKWAGKCGLFYQISEGAEVKNLRIVNSYIECTDYTSTYVENGSFAGRVLGTISNCYSNAILVHNNSSNKINHATGGIAGLANSTTAKISNCVFDGTITGVGRLGGILGSVNGSMSVEISNCLNLGSISSEKTQYVGGIVGRPSASTLLNKCINLSANISDKDGNPSDFVGGGTNKNLPDSSLPDVLTITDCIVVKGFSVGDENFVASYPADYTGEGTTPLWDVTTLTIDELLSENITKAGGALEGWTYRKNCIPTPTDITPPIEAAKYVIDLIGIENMLGLAMTGGSARADGYRFTATVNAGLLKALLKLGVSVKAMGTYVTLAENVTDAASFTPAALTAAGKTYKDISSNAGFYELPAEKDSYATIAGSVITTKTDVFAARAYVTVSYGGQNHTYLAAWSVETGTAPFVAPQS